MSRIGKAAHRDPRRRRSDDRRTTRVTVKGPRGTLTQTIHPDMRIVDRGRRRPVERPTTSGCTVRCTGSPAR